MKKILLSLVVLSVSFSANADHIKQIDDKPGTYTYVSPILFNVETGEVLGDWSDNLETHPAILDSENSNSVVFGKFKIVSGTPPKSAQMLNYQPAE